MDAFDVIVWILIFIGQCIIAAAIISTSSNTAAILKLLKDTTDAQRYKDWKERQSN